MPEPIKLVMHESVVPGHKTVEVRTYNGSKLISRRSFHPSRMDLAEWLAAHISKMGFTAEIVVRQFPGRKSAQTS